MGRLRQFLVPLIGSSLLDLHHGVYLLFYFAFVAALLAGYVRHNGIAVADVVRRNWTWSLLVGLVSLVPTIRNILSEDSTPHPDGAYFVFELVWRGAIYGDFNAILLTVFPCLVVYTALGGQLGTLGRKAAYVASLGLILAITASCHLGYEQYRDAGARMLTRRFGARRGELMRTRTCRASPRIRSETTSARGAGRSATGASAAIAGSSNAGSRKVSYSASRYSSAKNCWVHSSGSRPGLTQSAVFSRGASARQAS